MRHSNTIFFIGKKKKTTDEISNKYKKTILQGNELLITVRANIGDVRIIDKKFKGCNVGRGIPPLTLQNKFAAQVKKIEYQKQLLEQSLKELENNFNSLMQRAFNGELF